MPKYMILLREPPTAYRELSPEEIQAILQKYSQWRDRLEREGRFIGAQKLQESGRVLRQDGSRRSVVDGPYVEANEVLVGYFIVQADDYEQAMELAQGCPHLGRGPLEIREVEFG